ncbi:MAG: CBS domain-containing protein [Candidatus Thermoplasmatota archaeon]|jgi:IMP dehydrogenase|nr:CBS domain-containing protein [Candidatus Thermoplasmatota archaeon]MCL5800855.1 CBS domain-containing protein [Candidatus Thermoplasmatota archaeon]
MMVLSAGDIMRKDLSTVSGDISVLDASRIMMNDGAGFLIITNNGVPDGIITEWDVLVKVTAKQLDPSKTLIREVMTRNFIYVGPDSPTNRVVSIMKENKIRRLPVIENGKVVGVITSRDIIRIFEDYMDNIAEVSSRYGMA